MPGDFDDIQVGDTSETIGRVLTESDVVGFVNLTWCAQPRRVEGRWRIPPELLLGATLGLEGWEASLRGGIIALLEFDSVRFPAEAWTGDSIVIRTEVVAKRPSSRPDRGVVTLRTAAVTEAGTVVLELMRIALYRRAAGIASA